MSTTVLFSQPFTVHDPEQLRKAALGHPDATSDDTFFVNDDPKEGVDIKACIAMLMDPGFLPGCKSGNHEVEYIGGSDEDD